jgi:hypothetical protein
MLRRFGCRTLALMPPLDCRPPVTVSPRDSYPCALALGKGSCCITGGAVLHKASKQYLTATVTGLVVAILFSLAAIIVRSIAAPEMDGKISADAVHLKMLP